MCRMKGTAGKSRSCLCYAPFCCAMAINAQSRCHCSHAALPRQNTSAHSGTGVSPARKTGTKAQGIGIHHRSLTRPVEQLRYVRASDAHHVVPGLG